MDNGRQEIESEDSEGETIINFHTKERFLCELTQFLICIESIDNWNDSTYNEPNTEIWQVIMCRINTT